MADAAGRTDEQLQTDWKSAGSLAFQKVRKEFGRDNESFPISFFIPYALRSWCRHVRDSVPGRGDAVRDNIGEMIR